MGDTGVKKALMTAGFPGRPVDYVALPHAIYLLVRVSRMREACEGKNQS